MFDLFAGFPPVPHDGRERVVHVSAGHAVRRVPQPVRALVQGVVYRTPLKHPILNTDLDHGGKRHHGSRYLPKYLFKTYISKRCSIFKWMYVQRRLFFNLIQRNRKLNRYVDISHFLRHNIRSNFIFFMEQIMYIYELISYFHYEMF